MNQMNNEVATLALAASVIDRAHELMQDGYSKSSLNEGYKRIEKFCVHGAMNLAFQEMFPERQEECGRVNVCGGHAASKQGYGPIEAVATAILVDEATDRFGYNCNAWKASSMGVAPLNDDPKRSQADVLGILAGASKRLWAMSEES